MLIKGHGAPNGARHGNIGDMYLDLDTGYTYRCSDVKTETVDYGFVDVHIVPMDDPYTWVRIEDSSGGSSPDSAGEYASYEEALALGCQFPLLGTYMVITMKSYRIIDGIPMIPAGAVSQLPLLEYVYIPNSVTTIEPLAFEEDPALTTIDIDAAEGSIEGAPWGAPDTCTINWLR